MASAIEGVTGPENGRRTAAPYLDEGQRVWLSNLYESNFTAVFRACQRVLHNPEDAADAAHEVFLRAIDALPGRPAGDSARPWLIAVARNYCLDVLRRRKRLGSALVMLEAGSDQGVDAERAVDNRQVVDAVLQQLGLRERQALWQSAVEDRPVADIASYLGVTYMAAAQVLHRARRRAVLAAARLATIFGLYQLGRPARRVSIAATKMLSLKRQAPASGVSAAGLVVAAAMVPLMLATMVSSGAAHDRAAGAVAPIQSSSQKAAVTATVPTLSVGTAAAGNPAVPSGNGSQLPAVPLPSAGTSTVNSAMAAVARAITQLSSQPTPSAAPGVALPAPPLPGVTVPPVPLPVTTPKPKSATA